MDEDWLLYAVTSFTFAVIFSFCYIRHVFTFFERNKIPRASHPTFPFGNMYDVIFQNTPTFMQLWKFYNRFKRKGHLLGGFYIFLKPAVLIRNPGENILSENSEYFQNVNDAKNNNFSATVSEKLLHKISKKISVIWNNVLLQFPEEKQHVNFTLLMDNKFGEIIVEEFFGIKEVFHHEEHSALFTFQKLIFICCSQFNFLKKIAKSKKLNTILFEEIKKRQKQSIHKEDILQDLIKNDVSTDKIDDFVFTMMNNLQRTNDLILLTLYELCANTEIQEDLRGEITRFRKTNREINYNELSKLIYLEAVVCETLRKYPLVPFFYKICKKDFIEDSVNVPKDILVFVSTFGIHHDAKNYINPELYDPDRFSEENISFVESTKYIPFGCRGKDDFEAQYVKLIMKMTLIELLSRFKFSLGSKSPKSLQFNEKIFKSLKLKEDMLLKINKI